MVFSEIFIFNTLPYTYTLPSKGIQSNSILLQRSKQKHYWVDGEPTNPAESRSVYLSNVRLWGTLLMSWLNIRRSTVLLGQDDLGNKNNWNEVPIHTKTSCLISNKVFSLQWLVDFKRQVICDTISNLEGRSTWNETRTHFLRLGIIKTERLILW